jgi:hypothetical protein
MEVRAAADDGVRSEAAEVALDRATALAHEVLPLHDLPLDDALVGPRRYEEAAVGLREAVGEGHHVAEAPPHAELAAVGRLGGDEVGDVACRPRNDARGPSPGFRVLPRLGDSDLSEHRRRLAGLRGRGAGSGGLRDVILLDQLVHERLVVRASGSGGGGGGRWGGRRAEQGVGGGGRGRDTGEGIEGEGFEVLVSGGVRRRRGSGVHHGHRRRLGLVGKMGSGGEPAEESIGGGER